MARPVDVYITQAELEAGRKAKKTTCLKVDKSELIPVHCVSKPGISTGLQFAAPEPRRIGRYLNDTEMAVMYDKFVGPGSLNNAAVRHQRSEQDRSARISSADSAAPGSVSRAPSIDSGDRKPQLPSPPMAVIMAAAGRLVPEPLLEQHVQDRAAAAATMKYVAPRIAKKYGVHQSITPATARVAAAAAASAAYRSTGGTLAALAEKLQEADFTSTTGPDVVSGRPPRPPSAAFGAVSRDRAQRTGSHFVYGGPVDVPASTKYTPRYGAMEKTQHAPYLGPKVKAGDEEVGGSGAGGAAAAIGAEGADGTDGALSSRPWRPGSAPATRRRSTSRPSSARPSSARPATAAAAAATANNGLGQQAAAGGTSTRRALNRSQSSQGPGQHRAELRTQLQQRHEDLFGLAHRVHPPEPERPPASQPFKAVERKPLFGVPPGSHLFGEYYQEGYDSLTRKSSRPSSAFRAQTQRQWANGPLGETGPTVGPGTYGKRLPGTNTGRHVPAGHPALTKTPDWSRTTPRPVSAPPVRPPPASAVKQGYYGPEGPTASLFPDEPDYNELTSVRFLQEKTSVREPGLPPRRPASAQQPQQQSQLQQSQQQLLASQQLQQQGGAPGHSPAPPGLDPAANAKGEEGRPFTYVGPERFQSLSSTGFAKRVPGASFGAATREGTCHTMRVMGKNTVAPPAAVAVKAGQHLSYEYEYSVEGHRGRNPSWHLPPNRNALSQQWMAAAATAYLS